MPKAYASTTSADRYELKTCPGGYVKLRKMTYGEQIYHQQMTSSMRMSANQDKSFAGEMDLVTFEAIHYQFSKCIVEHNLEKDDNENLFDFNRAADLQNLDPQIGDEIKKFIDEMNQYNPDLSSEETQGKSETPSSDTESQKKAGSST